MSRQKMQRFKILAPVMLAMALLVTALLVIPVMAKTYRAEKYIIPEQEVVDFSSLDPGLAGNQVAYLTDGEAMQTAMSSGYYGQIIKDKTNSNAKITLKVEGAWKEFDKGVWAHPLANNASSVYFDLREYQGEYRYLLLYAGLNKTANSSGNVKFSVYTSAAETISKNVADWTVLPEADAVQQTVADDALYVKIDIRNVNYLWLKADANGGNSNDHAVYGDLKLVKESFELNEQLVPEVETLDVKIKNEFGGVNVADLENRPDYELAVLRRSLVNRAGRQTILSFLRASAENREAFNWLYNDYEALKMYINGGEVSHIGTYENSLNALSELYQYVVKGVGNDGKNDLEDRNALTTTSGTRGELYERMMITIALTHGEHVRLWVKDRIVNENGEMKDGEPADSANVSRPVDRYKVFKRMYLAGKLSTAIFEQLEVEEMRYIMETLMGDEEIEWLHDYMIHIGKGAYSYPPLPYRSAGYWHVEDYAEENQAAITSTYLLDGHASGLGDYLITNDKYQPRIWMILKWGGVCWQISNTGQNMASSFGVPSTTLGQRPDHVAYALYNVNADGEGYWGLSNNVYGWTTTDYVSYDGLYSYRYRNAPKRNMNGWGYFYDSRGYAYAYNGTYLLLAQAAINDYDNYVKANELVLLAKAYDGDSRKQEEIYEEAIKVQNINLDAWLGLIQIYKDRGASDQEYLQLTERLVQVYRTFPVPLYDLTRWYYGQIQDPAIKATVTNMQTQALTAATKLTAADSIQYSAQITLARHLLGVLDSRVATFSFDGEDAGKIILNDKYAGAAWEYSLDGGETWWGINENSSHTEWITEISYTLSPEEIAKVDVEHDIKIHFSGVAWKEENYYTIDITKNTLPTNLYANDWENRLIGVSDNMEWRIVNEDGNHGEWTSYRDSSPLRAGETTIEVRVARTGTSIESDTQEFTFHTDTDTAERKYLPVAHVAEVTASSEATGNAGYARYAIDATPNTRWHSSYDGTDTERWITFRFDHDVYLTGLEYLPNAQNGLILDGKVEVSKDGENWTLLGEIAGWRRGSYDTWRVIDFEPEDYARYVRITATNTDSNTANRTFVSARMFNLFEDSTKSDGHTSAAIDYSTTEPTNGEVIARFVKPTEDTVLKDNGPDTHVFTENGEYTFEYTANGADGKVTARVDWIDKEAPTGRIEFYCTDAGGVTACGPEGGKTNKTIEAKLIIENERYGFTVLNNSNSDESEDDEANDSGSELEEMIQAFLLDGDNPGDDPTVFTFMRNGTFTFRVQDKAGNIGEIPATVDWIDMALPKVSLQYSTFEQTDKPVTVKLVKVEADENTEDESGLDRGETDDFKPIVDGNKYDRDGLQYGEDFIVVNNNGSAEYTFTKNGEFSFEYKDEAGNTGVAVAKVDWITESEQPDDPDDNQPGDNNNPGNPENPDRPDESGKPNGGNGTNNNDGAGNYQPGQNNGGSAGDVIGNTGGSEGNSGTNSSNGNTGGSTSGNVKVEAEGLPEGAKVENKLLTLTSALRVKFGANSELYEVKFVGENGEVLDKGPEKVVFSVPSGKKLEGIYFVKGDGTTEAVEYTEVDDTHVEVKNPMSGKYLFDYAEPEDDALIVDSGVAGEEISLPRWYENPMLWWIGGGIVAVCIIGVGVNMALNRKR